MKIYKLFHKVDGYKAINTKGTKLEESFIEYGNDIDFSKHEGDNFEWYSESTDKDCDFPFINGSTPVISEEVYNIIAPLISQHSIITNIKVGERIFKIVDAYIIAGILDKEKSTIKYFKDGRIMNIKNYVFKLIPNIPSIFKIPELKTFTFVTEDVIKALIEAKKTEGLDYLECEVS